MESVLVIEGMEETTATSNVILLARTAQALLAISALHVEMERI